MANEPLDMSLRHGGRVLVIDVYVNTSAPLEEILRRLSRAAKGPKQDAVAITIREFTGDQGHAIWKEVQSMSTNVAAHPNAKPFPSEGSDGV